MHLGKTGLGLGVAVLGVTLAGGVAAAAMQPADVHQALLHPAAGQAAQDERKGPPLARLEQLLGSLVAAGKLTAEQRDAILAGLRDLEAKPAKERPAATPKPAKPEPKERADKDARKAEQKLRIEVHALLRDSTKSALAYLGLDRQALQAELRAGKSLADVAVAQGKTREGLIAAITAPASARLAERVTAGTVTAEQAAKLGEQVAAAAAKIADGKTASRSGTAPGNAKKR